MKELDRRVIYILLLLSILVPIGLGKTLPPARMESAERVYELVESVPSESYAILALDFGPGTQAENAPQAEVVFEHLLRRDVPVVVFTAYELGERFSIDVPMRVAKRLNDELGVERYRYGEAWVSLGFRPGRHIFLQAMSKSEDLVSFFGKDYASSSLTQFERFSRLRSLRNVGLFGQFTGLSGMLATYIQFLQRADTAIRLIHGCTSITIPETYIYLDSGQLAGALEGIAGGAWYSQLLAKAHHERAPDDALIINTALGVAHLVIILLIVCGNLITFGRRVHG